MITFDDIMKYSPENKKVFEELSALCINKKIVPYIGSGLSAFAGFPTWWNFLNPLYKECFKEDIPKSMDFIVAADEIEKEIGKEEFYNKVYTAMGGCTTDSAWNIILKKSKNQAVYIIPELFFGTIVTTNFDRILEHLHKDIPDFDIAFPNHLEKIEQIIQKRKRLLYKIHGCISDAKNIVFTKTKYNEVYYHDSDLVKSLSALFQGYNFLFLGCGLAITSGTIDEPIKLWKDLKSGMYHFAILSCNENECETRRIELENRNIYPIFYNSEIDKNHISVRIILDELLKKYNDRLFQIPQYKSQYIERDDSVIEKIKGKLIDNEFSACAITGFGGVGKTRIMSEYACKVEETDTKVFWYNAISADSVREQIYQFLLQKKLIAENEKDYEYIFRQFKNWMTDNKDWLFLLDNVENYEDINVFFNFDNTLKGKRHIVLTSRKENELPNIQPLDELKTFNTNESLKFLESHAEKKPDEYAEKIADLLGGLALALEQAAAYIREENKSYKGYFESLEKNGAISNLEKKRLSHTESVGATYNISIQRIKIAAAKELLNLFAFFAPDNIHSQWFIDAKDVLPENSKNNIQTKLNEIEDQIKKYSLVTIDNGKISIHRLLQEVIRKTIEREQEKWVDFCFTIMNVFLSIDTLSKVLGNMDDRQKFISIGFHAIEIFKHYRKTYFNNEVKLINLAQILNDIGVTYGDYIDYEKAKKCYKDAISIYSQYTPKYDSGIAMTYNNIALIYDSLGKYKEAQEYIDKSLLLKKSNFVSEIDMAHSYHTKGSVLYSMEEYKQSLFFFNKSLKIRIRELGEIHSDTARTYDQIGIVYYKMGKYTTSLKRLEKARIAREEVHGLCHNDVAITYNNIAIVYDEQEKYELALKWYHKALIISKKIFGSNHSEVATAYNNIGITLDNLGKYGFALKFLNSALEIRKNYWGEIHPDTADSYCSVGSIYFSMGDYEKALWHFKKSGKIRKQIEGYPDIADIYANIGMICEDKEHIECALKFYIKSYGILNETIGKIHPKTKECLRILQGAYEKIKNPQPFEQWINEKFQQKDNDKTE